MSPELRQACVAAIHVVVSDGSVLRGGRAALFVLGQSGYRRTAWVLKWPPMVWAVEVGYAVVARNRRFFSRFLFRG